MTGSVSIKPAERVSNVVKDTEPSLPPANFPVPEQSIETAGLGFIPALRDQRISNIIDLIKEIQAGRNPGQARFQSHDGTSKQLSGTILNKYETIAILRSHISPEHSLGSKHNPLPYQLAVLRPDLLEQTLAANDGRFYVTKKDGSKMIIQSQSAEAVLQAAQKDLGVAPTGVKSNAQMQVDLNARLSEPHGGQVSAYEIARAAIAAGFRDPKELNTIVSIALAESHTTKGFAWQNNRSNGFEGTIQLDRSAHTDKIKELNPGQLFDNLKTAKLVHEEAIRLYGNTEAAFARPWPQTYLKRNQEIYQQPAQTAIRQALADVDRLNRQQSHLRSLREGAQVP